MMKRKIEEVSKEVEINKKNLKDKMEVMRWMGGREIEEMEGEIIEERMEKIKVIVDGFVEREDDEVIYEEKKEEIDNWMLGNV